MLKVVTKLPKLAQARVSSLARAEAAEAGAPKAAAWASGGLKPASLKLVAAHIAPFELTGTAIKTSAWHPEPQARLTFEAPTDAGFVSRLNGGKVR